MRRSFATRFGAVWLFIALFLALQTLVRTILLAATWHAFDPRLKVVARIYGEGLLWDALAALYAVAPFTLYALFVPDRIWRSRLHRGALHALWILASFVLLFTATAEWYFWEEFASRFNFIAVDYLVYTREVIANIRESYPAAGLLVGMLGVATLAWLPLRGVLNRSFCAPSRLRERFLTALVLVAIPALAYWRIDLAALQVGEDRYATELASNGLYDFFHAFRIAELDYDAFYATHETDDSFRQLRTLLAEPNSHFVSDDLRSLTRDIRAAGEERRLNVIVIVVESLSAKYLAAYDGDGVGMTPRLDALAKDSLVFRHFYATGTRTVRGLEAISLSLPPTPGESIVKRPNNGGLFTIAEPFRERGYATTFFYGGYGFFDNMNSFFSANGFDVIDRSSLAPGEVTFENAWGVADEDLYRRVIRESRRSFEQGQRFFSLVMTTSNHRPYTYPDARIDIPSGQGREGALKYTDWAIGDFLETARKEPWFRDTLFLIVADHCASSSGRTAIPVEKYRIPFYVYAPAQVEPGVVGTLASQMDLAPTLFGLLRFRYTSKFFGRDILDEPPSAGRALLSTYQQLGYLKDDKLAVLSPGRRIEVFSVNPQTGKERLVPSTQDPDGIADAISYYQTASYAFLHGLVRWPDDTFQTAARR
ncbi:MAG TPA: sulfatase-like hydrolase/transferase [Myxococcota bacterium]|nr:sulfatase-like hydrolase/transferase [Myxococcota bacterium]